jgi:sulfur-oxidizing protein SoxY
MMRPLAVARKGFERRDLMEFSRRDTLALGLGAAVLTMMPFQVSASTDALIEEFTGGAPVVDSGVTLTAPEIAENGNTVPIEVSAPGASAIMVLAAGNPTPPVATFNFGPLAASQGASTRIRLAGTQDVIAVAKMADGSFARATSTVKVTIGGCGG